VTVVATQLMLHRAHEAADRLAGDGVSVELIDPRTLAPLDAAAIVASVKRTNRLVVVQEAPSAGSWGATVVARVLQDAFEMLDAPPAIVAADDTPVPYAAALEEAWLPSVERIGDVVHRTAAF
jgi:pyruvate/2-oxoglutarate/acetoin dehydrogenase E1 component